MMRIQVVSQEYAMIICAIMSILLNIMADAVDKILKHVDCSPSPSQSSNPSAWSLNATRIIRMQRRIAWLNGNENCQLQTLSVMAFFSHTEYLWSPSIAAVTFYKCNTKFININ